MKPPPRLLKPSILFSNNHLLVIHKPPGWSSMPTRDPQKSLLDYLKRQKLGGGSQQNFLEPVHRIDQPCSGLLLHAKTTKAASRITSVWTHKLVEKHYLCVLERKMLQQNVGKGWQLVQGSMPRRKTKGTVVVSKYDSRKDHMKAIQLEWRFVSSKHKNLIQVKTKQGARHMVRALLSSSSSNHGPLAGDLRYGARLPLKDQSVALHAQRVSLPKTLQLGTLEQRVFEAPIPETWETYFGIKQEDITE